jgi:hypothetical protein
MRKENDAIKRKLTEQIQDLRRQLVTKRAFDEEEAHKEITRLKKELKFLQKSSNGKRTKASSQNSENNFTKENIPKLPTNLNNNPISKLQSKKDN